VKKKTIIISAAVIVLLLLGLAMCGRKGGAETKVAKATRGTLVVTVSAYGTVRSSNEANLSTVSAGRISRIYAKENEFVRKGTILLDLDSTAQTEKDYRRMTALGEKGYVTSQQAEQAREMWENSVITAPFDGTVAKLFVDSGEMLVGGTPAILLADLNDMILETNIDETDIGSVKVGQKAEVTLDAYKDTKLTGTVQFIARSSLEIREKGITYLVKIKLSQPGVVLRLGMTGNVDIEITDKQNALMVPYTAVGEDKTVKFVMAVEKNVLRKKIVTTGLENYDSTEITSGLNENEVVAANATKLKEKMRIKPKY
jgi:RND family efflux transporter MFP subunit